MINTIKVFIMSKVKSKKQCDKCENWFSLKSGNFHKHHQKCTGVHIVPMKGICKYCGEDFSHLEKGSLIANHVKWCHKNPKREEYINTLAETRKNITQDSREKGNAKLKIAHAHGVYKDAPSKGVETKRRNGTLGHTEGSKKKIQEKALASPHRRLRKGIIEYKGILLESSWELALATRLDNIGVEWTRPAPIPWTDKEGLKHNYFPDFYLPEYDLYLDPKNPQARKVQKKKLEILLTQYKNIVILLTKKECEEYAPVSHPPSKRTSTE